MGKPPPSKEQVNTMKSSLTENENPSYHEWPIIEVEVNSIPGIHWGHLPNQAQLMYIEICML
jgi:hypothetical protein